MDPDSRPPLVRALLRPAAYPHRVESVDLVESLRERNVDFEQLIFPEAKSDDIASTHGMDITVVTSAKTDEEARALLRHLGFPFRQN